ncbi:DNA repair exonuclease [Candidatus Woesearchaeota archaeon]|nr:DNA repair exonuclease [Candidatus Woesearchaeota archaeon]
MKFAHFADCHIGSWRDPKLRGISTEVFIKTIDECIKREVDFVLIAGDLFNTSLPAIELLKEVVVKLKHLKEAGIPVYIIAGSHDFSPSGKTMLDVLEGAGLVVNVVKGSVEDGKLKLNFTVDIKTGVKITGMLGKKGMLDKAYYENLEHSNLVKEGGYKIFMFHTALTEFKPAEFENMESQPLSLLPKGFNYYAGGHVHYIFEKDEPEYGKITYPGALFPANFGELEKYGNGGFYIVTENNHEWVPISVLNTFNISVDCDHKTPEQVTHKINSYIEGIEFNNTIVILRVYGTLESGKISDINFNSIFKSLYDKSAYFVMKNTSGIKTSEFEEVKVAVQDVDKIEELMIKEHAGKIKVDEMDIDKEKSLVNSLLNILSLDKQEGERVSDFESRLKQELGGLLW